MYIDSTQHLVLEERNCSRCFGKREIINFQPCPRYNQAVNRLPGRKCEHCGATRKWDHHYIDKGIIPCTDCNATGRAMESVYDYAPKALWQSLTFKVYSAVNLTAMSWVDSYLALGSVFNCVDYGAHLKKTDEELIEHVKVGDASHQAVKFVHAKSLEVCAEIAIIRHRDGYKVVAMMRSSTGELVAAS